MINSRFTLSESTKLESEAESLGITSTERITLLLQLATAQYHIKFDKFDILCHLCLHSCKKKLIEIFNKAPWDSLVFDFTDFCFFERVCNAFMNMYNILWNHRFSINSWPSRNYIFLATNMAQSLKINVELWWLAFLINKDFILSDCFRHCYGYLN